MQCRSHAAQLARLYKEFQTADCEILLILGDSLEKAKRYTDILHLPFPVLADPERRVYHRYGLEKAMVFIQRTASVSFSALTPTDKSPPLNQTTSPDTQIDALVY